MQHFANKDKCLFIYFFLGPSLFMREEGEPTLLPIVLLHGKESCLVPGGKRLSKRCSKSVGKKCLEFLRMLLKACPKILMSILIFATTCFTKAKSNENDSKKSMLRPHRNTILKSTCELINIYKPQMTHPKQTGFHCSFHCF